MTDPVRIGLLSAYRRILKPLVRVLIRNGVSFGELSELLKNVFVEVAERDFNLPGRKTSQSRVAIITGLTRKEVAKQKRILDSGETLNVVTNLNRVIRVLVGWHADPEFTGPYGMPLELPFDSTTGPSFSDLVRRHSGDMAARAMLDELLRVHAVEKLTTGLLKVLTRTYIPESLNPDSLQRFGEVIRDFITTYAHNLEKKRPGRFERIVFADNGLRDDLMAGFDALIRTKGHNLLVELDNWLSAQETSPSARSKEAKRVKTGVGIYHFVDDQDDD
jgi:Family of unknown function (DUF6502)